MKDNALKKSRERKHRDKLRISEEYPVVIAANLERKRRKDTLSKHKDSDTC